MTGTVVFFLIVYTAPRACIRNPFVFVTVGNPNVALSGVPLGRNFDDGHNAA